MLVTASSAAGVTVPTVVSSPKTNAAPAVEIAGAFGDTVEEKAPMFVATNA